MQLSTPTALSHDHVQQYNHKKYSEGVKEHWCWDQHAFITSKHPVFRNHTSCSVSSDVPRAFPRPGTNTVWVLPPSLFVAT